MISHKLKKEIQNILESFSDSSYFVQCIRKFAEQGKAIEKLTSSIATSEQGHISHHVNVLRTHYSHVKSNTTEVKPRPFFSSIEKLQGELIKFQNSSVSDDKATSEIITELSKMSDVYERYIDTSYTIETVISLTVSAMHINSLVYGFKKGLEIYLNNIDESTSDFYEGRELSIMLPSTMDLHEFIIKLRSIENIYNELCNLSEISLVDYPIKIIKIESGSLFVKILGNAQIIALVSALILSGAAYIYRNYTTEGKLSALPRRVEAVENVLKLRQLLNEHGLKGGDLDEHINKSSIMIAKELTTLVSGQAEVIVNETKLSLGDEVRNHLISSNESLKITYSPDPSENN